MKKLFIALLLLLILLAGAGTAAWIYVSPDRNLDLAYEQVPLRERAIDMLRKLSLELDLSEAGVNNLAKESLARNPAYQPGVVVTGAEFHLASDNRLIADINLKIKDRLPVGLTLTYLLSWNDPNLTAKVVDAKLRDIRLSPSLFDEVVIPVGNELPKPVKVKDIFVQDGQLKVEFQKPKLRDLQKLLGG